MTIFYIDTCSNFCLRATDSNDYEIIYKHVNVLSNLEMSTVEVKLLNLKDEPVLKSQVIEGLLAILLSIKLLFSC